jgi:hypothetical protein|eukprot:COSAG01_NODE_774_length_13702_cov_11.108726_15_plen_32_part_00
MATVAGIDMEELPRRRGTGYGCLALRAPRDH